MYRYKRQKQRRIPKKYVRLLTISFFLLLCFGGVVIISFFAQTSNNSFLRFFRAKESIVFPGAYPHPSNIATFRSLLHKKILLVCHPEWHGIRQATYAQAGSMSLPVSTWAAPQTVRNFSINSCSVICISIFPVRRPIQTI